MTRIKKTSKHLLDILNEISFEKLSVYENGLYLKNKEALLYIGKGERLNSLSVAVESSDLYSLKMEEGNFYRFIVDDSTEIVDLNIKSRLDGELDKKKYIEIASLIEKLNPMTGIFGEKRLSQVWGELRDKISKDGLSSLIGLGLGLTPSGDDINLGISLARQAYGLDNLINLEDLNRTNLVSGKFLYYGLKGYFSEDGLDLFFGLEPDLYVKNIMKTGHTSGGDQLLGVYFAIREYII